MTIGPLITIGDHAYLQCTLRINGVAVPSLVGATVQAAITNRSRTQVLAGPITLSEATPGSDWANRVVVTTFDPDDTAGLPADAVVLEIQTVEGGIKQTWTHQIRAVRGVIG